MKLSIIQYHDMIHETREILTQKALVPKVIMLLLNL